MGDDIDLSSPAGPGVPRLFAAARKTGEPLLQLQGLNHYFGTGEGRKQVLFDNHFKAYPGELIIMTGPSGSGKTTLLTLIGALRSLQEGSLRFNGREYLGMSKAEQIRIRHEIGFIFQSHNLFESLTALENVRLATELMGPLPGPRIRRPEDILAALGLDQRLHYKPAKLSGGQRQRVAVARALVNRPKLILADEPTAALDKEAGRVVVNLIQDACRDEGCTALIVTHDSRILDVANRIVNMVDGRIVSDVDIAETREMLQLLQTVPLFKSLSVAVLKDISGKLARETHPAGTVIFRQGESGEKFYIVRRGHVDAVVAEEAKPTQQIRLGPSQFFGELALLRNQPRSATITTVDEVELLTLTRTEFLALMQAAPTFEEQVRKFFFTG
jgi:putative ABC transport system ATP-binding protein